MTSSAPVSRLYRATVEYDGTELLGFQIQAQGRTVQGELERVLQKVTGRLTRVIGSGRTDAGVHARGQVIAFRSAWRHTAADLQRALNALLPPDIAVLDLLPAPDDFHPRFSARERWYRYQLGTWPGHSPLRCRYAWEVGPGLDIEAMKQAAEALVGTYDFAAFGQPPQGDNTVRQVISAQWSEQPPYLVFDIRANAFLRRMVRTIVGTLVEVGQGRRSAGDVARLRDSRDRSQAAPPAPPQGLILMAVSYPDYD
ncbi:MAG: tRNA pseudouridine(38-40) synthase TruA [Caldilineae bacterium]|nr:MAG: tRNA pseudouridine(38-40) synthase TruA [Caldilineae bacterium]